MCTYRAFPHTGANVHFSRRLLDKCLVLCHFLFELLLHLAELPILLLRILHLVASQLLLLHFRDFLCVVLRMNTFAPLIAAGHCIPRAFKHSTMHELRGILESGTPLRCICMIFGRMHTLLLVLVKINGKHRLLYPLALERLESREYDHILVMCWNVVVNEFITSVVALNPFRLQTI